MTPSAHDEVVSATRKVLAGVPGVTVHDITAEYTPDRVWQVDIVATAWGPGLHAFKVRWCVHVDHRPTTLRLFAWLDRIQLRDTLRHRLDRFITRQYSRADRARAHGIDAPLPLPSAATAASTPGSIRIDHLVVDRQALHHLVEAISRSRGMAGADRASLDQQLSFDAASAYDTALQGPTVMAGESVRDDGVLVRGLNVIRKLPVTLREIVHADGTDSLLQATFDIGSGGTAASYDGSHLIILAPLPETVLTAAVGRTVGELAATGCGVDHRTILSAGRVGEASVINTPVDAVRLRDLPADVVTHADIDDMEQVA